MQSFAGVKTNNDPRKIMTRVIFMSKNKPSLNHILYKITKNSFKRGSESQSRLNINKPINPF